VAAYSPSLTDLARAEQQIEEALEEYVRRQGAQDWSDPWEGRVNELEMPTWWAKEVTT
jgi:hypothetical protein